MTDTEEQPGEVDMEAQRKSRTAQQRAVNRLIRSLKQMKENNTPITLSFQLIQEKENDLANILRRGNRCNDIILKEEIDEDTIQADEEALLLFQEATAKANTLCQELVVLKSVSCLSDEIQDSLQEVEGQIAEDPNKDYSASSTDIGKLLDEMAENLRNSTLELDHDLRKAAKEHRARLVKLRAQKVDPPKPIIRARTEDELQFNFPKINIPKFKGGLENWQAFWNRFKTAVHDNVKIQDPIKMVLLIDLITDPALSDYMVAANDGKSGRYQEVVAYLQERFNRPRESFTVSIVRSWQNYSPSRGHQQSCPRLLTPSSLQWQASGEVDKTVSSILQHPWLCPSYPSTSDWSGKTRQRMMRKSQT